MRPSCSFRISPDHPEIEVIDEFDDEKPLTDVKASNLSIMREKLPNDKILTKE